MGMNWKRTALTLAAAAIVFAAASAPAGEIYKWTDEDGNVHYEDRPSGAPTEERLALNFRRTDSGAVQQRINARHDRQSSRAEEKSMAEAARQEAAENAAAAEEREQACERARARLETYLQSPRLYRTDANGERVYLDAEQRQEARGKAEEQVKEFCS
jgi:hypothetical protein